MVLAVVYLEGRFQVNQHFPKSCVRMTRNLDLEFTSRENQRAGFLPLCRIAHDYSVFGLVFCSLAPED